MKTVKLTTQQLEDLISALSFTLREYPKNGARNFLADLRKVDKKLRRTAWGHTRTRRVK